MRLSPQQIDTIRTLLRTRLGDDSGIWLFGSRTDDNAVGGDIDLYVEPALLPESNLLLLRQKLKRDLEKRLHNAVDLIINDGRTTAFMRLARQEGIPL